MSEPERAEATGAGEIGAGEIGAGEIGWVRAILSGLAVILVAFLGGAYGANEILTKSLALTRTAREWLATGLVVLVVIVLAGALRWLQSRKLV